MLNLFRKLNEYLSLGNSVVMVTIVASSGSTPRSAGAKMLVGVTGRILGTIGGGAIEYKAEQIALETLEKKESYIKSFNLNNSQAAELGMVCGGNATLFFQFFDSSKDDYKRLFKAILQAMENNESYWLITDISDGNTGEFNIYTENGISQGAYDLPAELTKQLAKRTEIVKIDGKQYYAEYIYGDKNVYIFGGGHVAQALVPVLYRIGFRCAVFDDRPEFINDSLFDGLCQTRLIDFSAIEKTVRITENDYVVVMTRGHQYDTIVQAQVLRSPAYYIGVIGSRKKRASVESALTEMGFGKEDFGRIHSPIGIDIKAETPEEISISIAAELILERARQSIPLNS